MCSPCCQWFSLGVMYLMSKEVQLCREGGPYRVEEYRVLNRLGEQEFLVRYDVEMQLNSFVLSPKTVAEASIRVKRAVHRALVDPSRPRFMIGHQVAVGENNREVWMNYKLASKARRAVQPP